jgi:hypothetical protein
VPSTESFHHGSNITADNLGNGFPRGILTPGERQRFGVSYDGISPETIKLYVKRQAFLYVHGRVVYADFFGAPHWTDFCIYHIYGNPLGLFSFCHNEENRMDVSGRSPQ